MKCSLCKKDLPESEFYPSILKKGLRHCKKCMYKHYGKKSNYKYQKSLKELPEGDFDLYYGGYNIRVLNYTRPGEYRFVINATRGKTYKTNDFKDFMAILCHELKPEK